MRKLIIVALMCCSSVCSYAAHLGDVKIKRIRLFSNMALVTTDVAFQPAQCATSDTLFIVHLDETHASNRLYSTLLAAQAQQKVFNANCLNACDDSFPWAGSLTRCTEGSIQ